MKKTKHISLLILGLVLFLPLVTISPAQESYVGARSGQAYFRKLSLHKINWARYFDDKLEGTLENLFPLGPSANMTRFFFDWYYLDVFPPQSHWPFNIINVSTEETGTLIAPYDNTTITYTPFMATAGYKMSFNPDINSYYIGTWHIVNDTSSFLRQTLNLTLAFSPYGIMGVQFAPKTINWTLFVTEFLGVMNSKGGLYNNISATAKSNGYSLNVPAQGFETNSVSININVEYNSNGALTSYSFSLGEKVLASYWLNVPKIISTNDLNTIIVTAIFMIVIVLMVLIVRKIMKEPIYVGGM